MANMAESEALIVTSRPMTALGWLWALFGYTCFSFAAAPYALALEGSTFAIPILIIIGGFVWAGLGGGGLAVLARMMGGRGGVWATIRRLGSILVWPGVAAALLYVFTISQLQKEGDSENLGPTFLLSMILRPIVLLWALIATGLCMRKLHGLSWVKTVIILVVSVLMFYALVLVSASLRFL